MGRFHNGVPSNSELTTASPTLETVNGSLEFKITGYSQLKGMRIGKKIASETFMVGGYSWVIYFYPSGKSVEDKGTYISLFIALDSDGTDVAGLFELTLKDQSGKGRDKVYSHFERVLENGPYSLKHKGSMWGYKRFYNRTYLETSDYLKDDTLHVHCRVGVVKTHTRGPIMYSKPVPPSDIDQQVGHLMKSGKATDVNMEVDGENFHAQKLVPAARSPVSVQLSGPMKHQNTQCISKEDMEEPVGKTCENLEGRLDAVEKNILEKEDQAKKVPAEKQLAKKEKETVEKNILEKEDRAKKALAEKQLVMEKVVQEGNFLKQPEEENSELGDYLLDRVHVDDFVQEEISLVMEDMKLLKAKFDELHSLSKYLSFSQTTTCNLTAAFSSSPKSMAPEQVDEAIVQAGPSETAEKTNHLPYVTRTIRPIRDS